MPPAPVTHADAVNRLTTALRKTFIQALLRSWLARIDDLEAEVQDLGDKLYDIDALEGEPLRVIARTVGAPQVADDDEQRLLIETRLLVVRSSGTGDELLEILATFTAPGDVYLEELQPATVLVGKPYDFALADVAIGFLQAARAGGVKLQFLWSEAPEAETFRCALDVEYPAGALAAFEQVSGLTASYLWVGGLTDLVAGETLSAEGGAQAVTTAGDLYPTYGHDVYRFTGTDLEAFAGDTVTVGDVTAGTSWLLVAVVRVNTTDPAIPGIVGKRDLGVTNDGWNLVLNGSNLVTMSLDYSDVLASATLTAASTTLGDWRVIVALWDQDADELSLASDIEAATPVSTVGVVPLAVTEPLRLGDCRINSASPSIDGDVRLVAICEGVQVEGLNVLALAQDIYASIHPNVPTGTGRGFTDETFITDGGALLGVIE